MVDKVAAINLHRSRKGGGALGYICVCICVNKKENTKRVCLFVFLISKDLGTCVIHVEGLKLTIFKKKG